MEIMIIAGFITGFALWCVVFVFEVFTCLLLPLKTVEAISWFVYVGGVICIFFLTGSFLAAAVAAVVVQIIAKLMRDTVHGP
ncbi:MAG: hypothetical protein JNK33_04550 [Candidatus Doudnabacteria bacterium]|nr:hypothetical protein [Candidatus Doudnabacteria bacterium]